tara:strand:- start:2452 stop:2736 length:285 start_codon:yes stop_codon:yes gene_type:complete
MEYSKANKVLMNFLKDNNRHWSYQDFKTIFGKHNKELKKPTLASFKHNISMGKFRESQVSKYKTPIIELCKVVTKRLADEKEILESIKMHQAVN